MGLSSSQLQDPFRDFAKCTWWWWAQTWGRSAAAPFPLTALNPLKGNMSKASALLTTFKTSGVDFGAGWDDIALLLDGDTIAAKQIVKAFSINNSSM